MKTLLAAIGALVVVLALVLFAVCNEDEGEEFNGLARVTSHEYGGGYDERSRCYDGDCSDQDYDQWNNEDRNRNRNRNRGAFSPGPFDDSPVDAFNGNVVCLPGSTCENYDRRRDEERPDENRG
jgi:hypothetical protein